MSGFFMKKKLSNSNLFLHKKAPPRKKISLSAAQFSVAEAEREFGYQIPNIEAKCGDKLVRFDPQRGVWDLGISDESEKNAQEMAKLERKKQELEMENDQMKLKIDTLLNMLAELSAESEIRKEQQ